MRRKKKRRWRKKYISRPIVCVHIGFTGDRGTKFTVTAVYNTRASALRSYDPPRCIWVIWTHIHLGVANGFAVPAQPTAPLPVLPIPPHHSSPCVIPQL